MSNAKHKYPWAFEKEPKVEKQPCLELQELVDMSEFYLLIHSSILYGLIEGELPNAERCEHYLNMGKRFNLTPKKGYIPPDFNPDSYREIIIKK